MRGFWRDTRKRPGDALFVLGAVPLAWAMNWSGWAILIALLAGWALNMAAAIYRGDV